MPQSVGIVAVRIPQSNLVQALAHLLLALMFHLARIAFIGQQGCEPLTQPQMIIH
jgi:hypothetical protein